MNYAPLFSNKSDKNRFRRHLRLNQTKSETVLWNLLRRKSLKYRFRRQFQIGYYFVDFYCHKLKLIVELDGDVHLAEFQQKHDKKRDSWLVSMGYIVLRFTNEELLFDQDNVIERIEYKCIELSKTN
ncbi:endonuclease domain-containing protein [Candidatus Parcubacteria bacterium]|jgi:very-short-patch-repair endonuclease|nr:endonuclease domain-containing protein [Candidatus Parcubacteria bacterium]MBT3949058.1 endonuclease domain-containing protein [Candidatus Parcubacteria bacterium]